MDGPQFFSRMIVLDQSSFHTYWTSLFGMELQLNSLDWNENELEYELELEDMKHTMLPLRLRTAKFIPKQNSFLT